MQWLQYLAAFLIVFGLVSPILSIRKSKKEEGKKDLEPKDQGKYIRAKQRWWIVIGYMMVAAGYGLAIHIYEQVSGLDKLIAGILVATALVTLRFALEFYEEEKITGKYLANLLGTIALLVTAFLIDIM